MADAGELERQARLRELRALSLLYCGRDHPATIALTEAIADPSAADRALAQLDTLPALRRRRLLANYAALLPQARNGDRDRGAHGRAAERLG
jgi:hypothetical protein